jgi:hypothetical protein
MMVQFFQIARLLFVLLLFAVAPFSASAAQHEPIPVAAAGAEHAQTCQAAEQVDIRDRHETAQEDCGGDERTVYETDAQEYALLESSVRSCVQAVTAFSQVLPLVVRSRALKTLDRPPRLQ